MENKTTHSPPPHSAELTRSRYGGSSSADQLAEALENLFSEQPPAPRSSPTHTNQMSSPAIQKPSYLYNFSPVEIYVPAAVTDSTNAASNQANAIERQDEQTGNINTSSLSQRQVKIAPTATVADCEGNIAIPLKQEQEDEYCFKPYFPEMYQTHTGEQLMAMGVPFRETVEDPYSPINCFIKETIESLAQQRIECSSIGRDQYKKQSLLRIAKNIALNLSQQVNEHIDQALETKQYSIHQLTETVNTTLTKLFRREHAYEYKERTAYINRQVDRQGIKLTAIVEDLLTEQKVDRGLPKYRSVKKEFILSLDYIIRTFLLHAHQEGQS